MVIAVIGLGSMGRRRARLIHQIDPKIELVGVDLQESRRVEFTEDGWAYTSLDEALSNADVTAAFVCTSPATHAGIIGECLDAGLHVFTELNLVPDGYERNMALAGERGLILFLSSTFLYRRETRYIVDRAKALDGGLYTYHVGQYLPDWHPWENYRDFFAADARTNGCRELFAIELPWLVEAFGAVRAVHRVGSSQSSLDLPYDDTYAVILEHEGGAVGTLAVDVVCRHPVRRFEYSHENAYLTWDGTPDTLRELDFEAHGLKTVDLYPGGADRLSDYASFVVEDAYRDEVGRFLQALSGGPLPAYGFAEDAAVLAVIDEIEGIA